MNLSIGIDASRIRSGGGKAHMIGFLPAGNPTAYGISKVHLWSYKGLLDVLPDAPWLIKHNPPALERSLFRQAWWQARSLPKEVKRCGCDLLFAADAATTCGFHPSVVMSQDMLSYEPGQMSHYGWTMKRLRLILIGYLQTRALKRADAAIFLTQYAANVIQGHAGPLQKYKVIPHGIAAAFRQNTAMGDWPTDPARPIRCIYVSNAAMYKHQWEVVRAVGLLRKRAINISLLLVGGGAGLAQKMTVDAIAEVDPQRRFIEQKAFVPNAEIPKLLAGSDIFVFASSCENLPITLLEGMAGGLPIACSDRGPMPEVLADGGVYFNPEDPNSIASAIEKLITDRDLRMKTARRAEEISESFTWERCADETWEYLSKCAIARKGRGEYRSVNASQDESE